MITFSTGLCSNSQMCLYLRVLEIVLMNHFRYPYLLWINVTTQYTEHGEDQAMVYMNITCDSLIIFNGFSPNDDGINDGFTIQGIEAFEDNEICIFNRWGNQIFDQKNYSNDNQWTGDWNGKDLPDGT